MSVLHEIEGGALALFHAELPLLTLDGFDDAPSHAASAGAQFSAGKQSAFLVSNIEEANDRENRHFPLHLYIS